MARRDDKGKGRPVSFAPEDMTSAPQPLNLDNARAIAAIHDLSLREFVSQYSYPPTDVDGYFDMRGVPTIWEDCVSKFSVPHLFLYSVCTCSADKSLSVWHASRERALELCREKGDEPSMTWLQRRPQYKLRMDTLSRKRRFAAWGRKVLEWLSDQARTYGVTSKTLFIIYSSKAMLAEADNGGVDLKGFRSALEEEVNSWDDWVAQEGDKIRRTFKLP
jgi:hypothetical protein